MAKRVKVILAAPIESRADLEAVVRDLCRATIDLDADTAAMDAAIASVRERHEAQRSQLSSSIDTNVRRIQAWAESHRDEFGDKKSLDLVHGTIGFRTGMPALKPLPGWTWKLVLENLIKNAQRFVRVKKEEDREAILAERETLKEEGLKKLGLDVHQGETFYVEPKRESLSEGVFNATS